MSKSNRVNILKSKLSNASFYKLDCDIDNFEINKITDLIYIYVIAGFSAIDLRLDIDLVIKAKETILKAINYAKEIEKPILFSPFLFKLLLIRINKNGFNKFEKVLKSCQKEGAEFIELHIDISDINLIKDKLLLAKEVFSFKPISINISRDKFSNANIVELIKIFRAKIQKDIIIEVDGSEEKNNYYYNGTLQSISTADIINKQLLKKEIAFRKIPIILSGGTNSLTFELAKECNVDFNGITFRDYATAHFDKFIKSNSSINDLEIKNYIKKIKNLII